MERTDIKISYSRGRGKNGRKYVYVRPSGDCSNKSRRCRAENLQYLIEKHFPVVQYYNVDGWTIGAKNERAALGEYWRICDYPKIGQDFKVQLLDGLTQITP